MRPKCPRCGEWSTLTDERYGGKYECLDCDMWAWGGKPLRSREENAALREGRGRKPTEELMGLGDDDHMWAATTAPAWAAVLGVDYPTTLDAVNAAYRRLARERHPDLGGTAEAMQRLNDARAEAHKELKPRT